MSGAKTEVKKRYFAKLSRTSNMDVNHCGPQFGGRTVFITIGRQHRTVKKIVAEIHK